MSAAISAAAFTTTAHAGGRPDLRIHHAEETPEIVLTPVGDHIVSYQPKSSKQLAHRIVDASTTPDQLVSWLGERGVVVDVTHLRDAAQLANYVVPRLAAHERARLTHQDPTWASDHIRATPCYVVHQATTRLQLESWAAFPGALLDITGLKQGEWLPKTVRGSLYFAGPVTAPHLEQVHGRIFFPRNCIGEICLPNLTMLNGQKYTPTHNDVRRFQNRTQGLAPAHG